MTGATRREKEERRAEKLGKCRMRAHLALDALEGMVTQYLHEEGDRAGGDVDYGHDFMSAGEEACDVLAQLRPDRWQLTASGVKRLDGEQ